VVAGPEFALSDTPPDSCHQLEKALVERSCLVGASRSHPGQ
jgi:hypothetical protein